MELEFSGSYSKIGEEEITFSFTKEVSEEIGNGYLNDREEGGDGYPYYGAVKNVVVAHLIESEVLPRSFHAEVYYFSKALSEAGLATLNFKMSADGYGAINFLCLGGSK